MAYTDINSEDRLVQQTFAEHLKEALGWETEYAYNDETFGPDGMLGRTDKREVVLTRDLRAALVRLNPKLPTKAIDDAVDKMTRHDFSRSLLQHNQEFHDWIRDGVPVAYRNADGQLHEPKARVIDFDNGTGADGQPNNRFLAVRELWITGLRAPSYNRRADLVCFVNGIPLVFIELKAVYRNIRAGFDGNLSDYMDDHVIGHAFHHNAFLIVSNGDKARYGSITSGWDHFAEWKRNDERDKGKVSAEVLLNGMLAKDRLLDLVENFVLFDASRAGKTRKVVARNHQVLGVNAAVESVKRQEELKRQFPERRTTTRFQIRRKDQWSDAIPRLPADERDAPALVADRQGEIFELPLVQRAHPDLGRLGVFWHTQGSGKSYSMAFFTEKVRRKLKGVFTFVLMTDRDDLDDQIYRTFGGCGVINRETTPRAISGKDLQRLLSENHSYIFTLIHKFNQDVTEPYSERDDIIVISDEAHRTQAGKFALNMRKALPNAAFIGFTGTPLFKSDQLTKRIFGGYISRYDFKRSEEDGATVKLVYENRGEKLGITTLDLNDKIAEVIENTDLSEDQRAHLDKLLGKDYEVITAPKRLEKIAADFVEHCAARWESGKAMLVCIDKITCGRMFNLIMPHWKAKTAAVKAAAEAESDEEKKAKLTKQAKWMTETIIELQISEEQGERKEFEKWGVDIIPHRERMKKGFDVTKDGKSETLTMEDAFKELEHPFRVVIVCAMWLTGFDVECLSTLYIDKPMKAHTLMQAIARANRRYQDKDFGLIVDYNGMLKSLRAALAQYALGDGDDQGSDEIVAPIEERVQALEEAIGATEAHLKGLGFDCAALIGVKGFAKLGLLRDAVEAVYKSRETKQRFEIMARQVFIRFKALIMEETVHLFAERHDNLEAIYKKLEERRDMSDVTTVLKQLHLIVNEAIRTQQAGDDQTEAKTYDLSQIDMEKLRGEFAKKITHKATAVEDLRELIERKLALMMQRNPDRMDYYRKYSEIVADYNREKDRVTIEETFARLVTLMASLNVEQRRATEEGLTEDELAVFDLLKKDKLTQKQRETVKAASKHLLARVLEIITTRHNWIAKEPTKAEVEVLIQEEVFTLLPEPPFDEDEKMALAGRVYQHVFRQSEAGVFGAKAA